MNDDDVNVQFVLDDNGDLLILSERPMQQMRVKRIDAECLYTLLGAQFDKPKATAGTSYAVSRSVEVFLAHRHRDADMFRAGFLKGFHG